MAIKIENDLLFFHHHHHYHPDGNERDSKGMHMGGHPIVTKLTNVKVNHLTDIDLHILETKMK